MCRCVGFPISSSLSHIPTPYSVEPSLATNTINTLLPSNSNKFARTMQRRDHRIGPRAKFKCEFSSRCARSFRFPLPKKQKAPQFYRGLALVGPALSDPGNANENKSRGDAAPNYMATQETCQAGPVRGCRKSQDTQFEYLYSEDSSDIPGAGSNSLIKF
ncbi:hypothetical protein K438DRAFT_1938167 [Mycena galopus ATCC 62051]|nr:hypothetical protein K438DRAFT_1938167 [Mycena galopus ATCC 62051]